MILTPTALVRVGLLQEDLSTVVNRWRLPFERCHVRKHLPKDEQYKLLEVSRAPRFIVLTKSYSGSRNFDGFNSVFVCLAYSEQRAEDSYKEFCRVAGGVEFRPPLKDLYEGVKHFLLDFVERVEKPRK